MTTHDLRTLVEGASRQVGLLWPLDRAVAVNPLLDSIDDDFSTSVSSLGARLGIDPWPTQEHLDELARRGGARPTSTQQGPRTANRLPTIAERSDLGRSNRQGVERAMVGQVLLEATARPSEIGGGVLDRARQVLTDRASWVVAPRAVRSITAALLESLEIGGLIDRLGSWTDPEVEEELARHFARLPGWASWAKWHDAWDRDGHPAGVTRLEFLSLSLAVDLAWLDYVRASYPSPPVPLVADSPSSGLERLEQLEASVHGSMVERLAPRHAVEVPEPRFQVVTCIDVRSEPLRRALEERADLETFGFAGFFGVLATVQPSGDREAYESLPVLAAPSAAIVGGPLPTAGEDERVAAGGTLAELTHEPTAMFALAETTGLLGSPLLVLRSFLHGREAGSPEIPGDWRLEADGVVDIAEGALRGMGLTGPFAPEVLFLGHGSTTANNPHFATLECGACAGHAGGPNAAALAGALNDPEVRRALADRGIAIPEATRFLSGVHDTTREVITIDGGASDELDSVLTSASGEVARWRSGDERLSTDAARRRLASKAADWAEVRPEWGLANHAAFVVAARSSIRGIDLEGRSFLHSYDPSHDEDGAILTSILAAPVVVAQWINAAYYFSTVAPGVLGAGDKTLLNPVGDFAVLEADDPDLRVGLPFQSVATGQRSVHLPVRLLVAVEAPLERTAAAVLSTPMPRQLVEGEWVRLVGRAGPLEPWVPWIPGSGWATP